MTTLNKLNRITALSAGDIFQVWGTANGDLRGCATSVLIEYIEGIALTNIKLATYTVTTAPTGSVGEIIYVTNGDAGSPCLAVHNGTDWKVVSLGATISI